MLWEGYGYSMNRIQVLDCTLRDGGYCNQWNFGYDNIHKIILSLTEADIDIIECGFLTDKEEYDCDITKFTTLGNLLPFLPKAQDRKLFVAMINYGEYDVDKLPRRSGNTLDGIRLAFHKKNMLQALEVCRRIQEKGYLVFVQPMVSIGYSDEEFIHLIRLVNELKLYAFYIVDSFGMMKEKDLIRLFYMVEHNLDVSIRIGFHSHNNMQLAYSNAQKLVTIQTGRNIIIDTSVYGMGRGAGNLNTELFVEYLNENIGTVYQLKPLLRIIDEVIHEFYQKNYWGYSLPNYLSAKHNAHPNYAKYLDDKKTLRIEDMEAIFEMMDAERCLSFDVDYIEDLYICYMNKAYKERKRDMGEVELSQIMDGKKILLIAPGKSSVEEKDIMMEYMLRNKAIAISVNFEYQYVETDYIFLSNLRRFRELDESKYGKCIVTSNIPAKKVFLRAKYQELLNDDEIVKDKAGLMAIRFLMKYNISEIALAGFDGYSHDAEENYGEKKMAFYTRSEVLDAMNERMGEVIKQYAKEVNIVFLTKKRFLKV
jgi:Isopropylmalate/homocitrate/citramalate synthases